MISLQPKTDGFLLRVRKRRVLFLWQRTALAPGGMRLVLRLGPLEIYTRSW